MSIPAYIIDEILKERARRESPVLEELQIEQDIPANISKIEQRDEEVRRGVEKVEFFI